MSLSELFWLFVMLSVLQPVVRQKILDATRLRLLTRFERRRGSRAIALVHREETMALLGFPVMRYIDVHDSEEPRARATGGGAGGTAFRGRHRARGARGARPWGDPTRASPPGRDLGRPRPRSSGTTLMS